MRCHVSSTALQRVQAAANPSQYEKEEWRPKWAKTNGFTVSAHRVKTMRLKLSPKHASQPNYLSSKSSRVKGQLHYPEKVVAFYPKCGMMTLSNATTKAANEDKDVHGTVKI